MCWCLVFLWPSSASADFASRDLLLQSKLSGIPKDGPNLDMVYSDDMETESSNRRYSTHQHQRDFRPRVGRRAQQQQQQQYPGDRFTDFGLTEEELGDFGGGGYPEGFGKAPDFGGRPYRQRPLQPVYEGEQQQYNNNDDGNSNRVGINGGSPLGAFGTILRLLSYLVRVVSNDGLRLIASSML